MKNWRVARVVERIGGLQQEEYKSWRENTQHEGGYSDAYRRSVQLKGQSCRLYREMYDPEGKYTTRGGGGRRNIRSREEMYD